MVTSSSLALDAARGADARPDTEISVHESGPGTSVFLESGNTDGWIASDVTVDVRR